MTETFNLLTEQIKTNCLDYISSLKAGDYVVTIKDKKETRRAAQHRLKWLWMGFLAKELIGEGHGFDAQGWNAFFKEKYIKELLVAQDEKFVDEFARLRRKAIALKNGLSYEDYIKAKSDLWNEVKTEWLYVNEMIRFMELIEQYCTFELGVQLPIPDDLKWLYDE